MKTSPRILDYPARAAAKSPNGYPVTAVRGFGKAVWIIFSDLVLGQDEQVHQVTPVVWDKSGSPSLLVSN